MARKHLVRAKVFQAPGVQPGVIVSVIGGSLIVLALLYWICVA